MSGEGRRQEEEQEAASTGRKKDEEAVATAASNQPNEHHQVLPLSFSSFSATCYSKGDFQTSTPLSALQIATVTPSYFLHQHGRIDQYFIFQYRQLYQSIFSNISQYGVKVFIQERSPITSSYLKIKSISSAFLFMLQETKSFKCSDVRVNSQRFTKGSFEELENQVLRGT